MDKPTGKRCRKCGEVKSLESFNRNRSRPDGLADWCRECGREDARRRRAANPEAARKASRENQRRRRAANPEAVRETDRRYREKNRASVNEAKKRRYAANPDPKRAAEHRRYEANREAIQEVSRRRHAEHREAVFSHYGRECACCGSIDRLTIDHVGGNGGEHREEIGHGSTILYRWLVSNGFPDGFQVLCLRCNQSKGDRAACQINHQAAGVA